jgi:hypothetical protein
VPKHGVDAPCVVPHLDAAPVGGPAVAPAATRYATPNGSTTSPLCAANDPCRIDRAISGAAVGDEVVVASGVYRPTVPLRAGVRIDLHGDPDHSSPRIIGPASLKSSLLTFTAGTLGHLSLESAAAGEDALTLEGGVADGIRLLAAAGDGGTLVTSSAGTVLRNSVVRTSDRSGGAAGLSLIERGGDGHVELRNVTVMAIAGSATGIRCDVQAGTASLVNTLVRGHGLDIDARSQCTAAFSNFRPAFSTGLAPGAGNQSAQPLFADGDYRPAAGSPTIDAGALDAFASSPDPDGRPRALGAAPDIGAYEYAPVATSDGGPSAELPDALKGVPLPSRASASSSRRRVARCGSANAGPPASRSSTSRDASPSARSSTRAGAVCSWSAPSAAARCRRGCSGARRSRRARPAAAAA